MKRLFPPVITLLTDFGNKDAYVAAMKGVILQIYPEARIIDVSHQVRKFDIRHGAFLLSQAAPYFPEGTIHVAVIDPGVGTERRRIIVEGRRSYYVGPDNGVLVLAAKREGMVRVVGITNPRYMLPNPSKTFEGRDVFAPAAAYLANGVDLKEFGEQVEGPVQPPFVEPFVGGNRILGEILHIDDFGNLITNVSRQNLLTIGAREESSLKVRVEDRVEVLRFCRAYGEVAEGTPLLIVGSSDFVEVSVNRGNASTSFGAEAGETVEVSAAR